MPRTFIAGGNIKPKRLLRLSGSNTVVQAGENERPAMFVSGLDTRRAPLVGFEDAFTAIAGEPVLAYQPGETATVAAGAAVAANTRIEPDADGRAVAAGNSEHSYGIALTAATAENQDIQVLLVYTAPTA